MAAVSTTSSNVATGTETTCSGATVRSNAIGPYYDVIQSFKVQVGTESTNGQTVVLTYTLVAP
jgi:hypothetical protein